MRSSLRARVQLAVVVSTAASTGLVAAAPALASPGNHAQRGSAYAGSTLRGHDSPAAGKTSNTPGAGDAGTSNAPAQRALTNTKSRTIGIDVSSYQGNVNWSAQWKSGVRFAYVKATEGTYYTNPYFAQQYNGSYKVGMIRGAYHFGIPSSPAIAQANYFVAHGGKWSADGKTLPPALDIEYNPYGASCYGLSPSAMVTWLKTFANQVHKKAGRYPVIYTTTDWWRTCTGNSSALAKTDPIWIANWSNSAGTLPAGWKTWKFWQYSNGGGVLDRDVFHGGLAALKKFARKR
jgi:GH25 family lysozyme M1 (1,4-beta-N-acetylmuramidase)